MPPSRVLSTFVVVFYLLVAGAIPIADAVLARGSDMDALSSSPGERSENGSTDHERCSLCILLDRLPAPPGGADAPPAPVLAPRSAAFFEEPRSALDSRPAPVPGARAPPLA